MGSPHYQNDGKPITSGPGFGVTCHPDELDRPYRWRKHKRNFVSSMSDVFHPDVPDDFLARMWAVMVDTDQTYQVLTKRSKRMRDWVTEAHPGIWCGVSIENDAYTFRADHLRATAAALRFLSVEPLIGPVPSLDLTGIDWCIIGAESGRGARPIDVGWVRDIRDRCIDAGTAVFVKQLGTVWARQQGLRSLHGDDITLFPADLRTRDFPIPVRA